MPSTTTGLLAPTPKHLVLSSLQMLRQVMKSSASARLTSVVRGEARARTLSMLMRAMIRVWAYIVGTGGTGRVSFQLGDTWVNGCAAQKGQESIREAFSWTSYIAFFDMFLFFFMLRCLVCSDSGVVRTLPFTAFIFGHRSSKHFSPCAHQWLKKYTITQDSRGLRLVETTTHLFKRIQT